MTAEIELREGFFYGPWRAPANPGRQTTGNIHSEDTARELGFRGGLVAGSIHLEMFPPLLNRAFGERWVEKGSLSLYFLSPTLHGEEVRAVVGKPSTQGDVQVEAWAERPNGERICEGTAAVGEPAQPSALRARQLDRHPVNEVRILARLHPGDDLPEVDTRVEPEQVDQRLKVITEPLDWYRDPSRWGGRLPTFVNLVNALIQPAYAYLGGRQAAGAVGLYGAIEVRNVNGPFLVDRTYRAGGRLLHVGDTPKTEFLWFDTWAENARRRVAEMRMMLRYMKASSPLYQEEAARATA